MTHIHDQEDAVVFAEQRSLFFSREVSGEELKTLIACFVFDLSTALREKGCKLIGHIKGKLDTDEGEQLFFNTTTFSQKPCLQGEIKGNIQNTDMSINIIVYGISKKEVSRIYEIGMRRIIENLLFPRP